MSADLVTFGTIGYPRSGFQGVVRAGVAYSPMRIIVTGPNASFLMGGEAQKPLRFFLEYRKLGHDVTLITHSRNRGHLEKILPGSDLDRVMYVDDPVWLLRIYNWAEKRRHSHDRLFRNVMSFMWVYQQWQTRHYIFRISRHCKIDLVHVASPISIYRPLIRIRGSETVAIGPLAKGLGSSLMPDSARLETDRRKERVGRILNRLLPGKRHADFIIHDGHHARDLIERIISPRGLLIDIIHNGVTEDWFDVASLEQTPERPRVVFFGRYVEWKGLMYLLRAAEALPDVEFDIIGDGDLRETMESYVSHPA